MPGRSVRSRKGVALRNVVARSARILFAAAALGSLGACASTGPGGEGLASPAESDPLEPLNRNIFAINDAVDTVLLEPAADTYRTLVPDGTRRAVRNLLRYVKTPVILANNLLQGDLDAASNTTHRFLINTITLGLDDPAERDGFTFDDTGFGETLAVWGVGEGFYVVLPLFGPSTARDGVGLGVDAAMDPTTYAGGVTVIQSGAKAIDGRSRFLDEFNDLERNSLDLYAAVRSFYLQNRRAELGVGGTDRFGPGDEEWDKAVSGDGSVEFDPKAAPAQ